MAYYLFTGENSKCFDMICSELASWKKVLIQFFVWCPQGIVNIASVSLQIGYPTVASVPHSIINGFKNLAAVAVETNITFPQVEQLKAYLENPEAFASLVPAAATETAAAPAEDTKDEKKEEEEEEESDDDMGFGLFD